MKTLMIAMVAFLVAGSVSLVLAHGAGNMGVHGTMVDHGSCRGMWRAASGWMGTMGHPGIEGHHVTGEHGGHACPWDGYMVGQPAQVAEPLTKDEARAMAEHLVTDNPRLAVGSIQERDGEFIFDIVTREADALVDRIIIDRQTREARPVR